MCGESGFELPIAQGIQHGLQGELAYIESLVRQKLSEDDIQRFGVKEMTLSRMVDDMVLEKFARELNLRVSNKSIRDLIGDMPMFQDKNGKLDEQRFRDLLADAGMTEASYIGKVRGSLPAFVLSECIFPRSGEVYSQYYDGRSEKAQGKGCNEHKKQKARELFSAGVRKANEIISHGATSFSEVADVFKATMGILRNFDSNGQDPRVGKPSHFVSIGNAYFSVIVTGVIPSRARTFDESKPLLLDRWKDAFVAGEMLKISSDLIAKLKVGESPSKAVGIVTKKGENISRVNRKKGGGSNYPEDLVDQVFEMRIGDVSEGVVDRSANKIFIATLKEIKTPSQVNEKELKEFQAHFVSSAISSIRRQLLGHLINRYSVKINKKLLERV
ncbi:hypothetical protein GH714_042659 [Hevea brasiliensis]|uniref:Uncharacterized protein n=1 Tax=Hevea brasiliensis TaxID=3981 RepID=A0A6A6K055_HEVBR|nr:hypothetical protein GH714_042659 [Hevea brasiliensis]